MTPGDNAKRTTFAIGPLLIDGFRTFKGNKAAFALTWALLQESLECRFDAPLV